MTDVVFPGTSDASYDSMMSLFGTPPSAQMQTPNLGPSHMTMPRAHFTASHLPMTPTATSLAHRNPSYSMPDLSISHVASLKTKKTFHRPSQPTATTSQHMQSLTPGASNPAVAKVSNRLFQSNLSETGQYQNYF